MAGEIAEWARPPWRLRDLEGRGRIGAVALLAILFVPPVLALVRALHDGWIPSGDEANIAVRALDVFSRHPPLTGLPSTSGLYGSNIRTNHPGPIEFYLLAVPLRVLGMTAGPLLTATTINAGAVVISVWVCFRRLGYASMLWAGVLAVAFMWSTGTVVLSDTLSSNMTTYSLLATAVLVWAVVDGDARLLPLAAFVASYAAQQHLAAGIVVGALATFAIIAVPLIAWSRRRAGAAPTELPWRRNALLAAGVLGVCWLPVVADEVSGNPGNLTAIVRFARDGRPTLGLERGLFQAVHAVAPPSILGHSVSSGLAFIAQPSVLTWTLGVSVVCVLACIAWVQRTERPSLARLAIIALVLLAAGVENGSSVPFSIERVRTNLYRWTWTAAFLAWLAIGIAVAASAHRLVKRRGGRLESAWSPVRAVTLLVAAALLAAAVAFVPEHSSHNREQPAFRAEKIINATVLAHLPARRPVRVVMYGTDATLSVGPALIFRLVQTGHRVEIDSFAEPFYGSWRLYRPKSNPVTIVVTSGEAELPYGVGELLAWQPFGAPADPSFRALAKRRSELIASLSRQALGRSVVLTPEETRFLDASKNSLSTLALKLSLFQLQTTPATSLRNPNVLRLVLDGAVRAPVLDRTEVQELLDFPRSSHRSTYGDEQVQVHLIEPGVSS
jgi:hypothetical protein